MSGFKGNPDDLAAAAASWDEKTGALRGFMAQISELADQAKEAWAGHASKAFTDASERWNEVMHKSSGTLGNIGENLNSASAEYAGTEETSKESFAMNFGEDTFSDGRNSGDKADDGDGKSGDRKTATEAAQPVDYEEKLPAKESPDDSGNGGDPSKYKAGTFQEHGPLAGGKPGEYVDGVRADEGIPVGGREYFGDTFTPKEGEDPKKKAQYLGAAAVPYTLDENGYPVLSGPAVPGSEVAPDQDGSWRGIPTGKLEMSDGTNLLFVNKEDFADHPVTTTEVYRVNGDQPLVKVGEIPGVTNVTAVEGPDGGLIMSGSHDGAGRQMWTTPPFNGDYSSIGSVAASAPSTPIAASDEPADLFRFGSPEHPMYAMLSSANGGPDGNAIQLRMGSSYAELMASPPQNVVPNGTYDHSYSPHVQNIVPDGNGGYRVVMGLSLWPHNSDSGDAAVQNTYEVITGSFTVTPD